MLTRTERSKGSPTSEDGDSVHVAELADEFRCPLSPFATTCLSLHAKGSSPVRGGVRGSNEDNRSSGFRLHLQSPEKRAIASAAAAMVGDGESVALDSSTTAYYLAGARKTRSSS
jgi:hypothetical protein